MQNLTVNSQNTDIQFFCDVCLILSLYCLYLASLFPNVYLYSWFFFVTDLWRWISQVSCASHEHPFPRSHASILRELDPNTFHAAQWCPPSPPDRFSYALSDSNENTLQLSRGYALYAGEEIIAINWLQTVNSTPFIVTDFYGRDIYPTKLW